MMKRAANWKDYIFENGSYKLVSLFVTLILWVTILGRRDFMLTKDMDVEFLLPPNAVMQSARGERKISVKVSGPRTALKKFAQSPGSITFDLTKSEVEQRNTKVKAVIQVKNIEVPFGVKVVSIDPDSIDVILSPIEVSAKADDAASTKDLEESLDGSQAIKAKAGRKKEK